MGPQKDSDGSHISSVSDEEATGRPSQSRTVLLADDDDEFRERLHSWLASAEPWEIREARNGKETLEMLDESVDVLVLDRRIPKLSGSEVVEQLDQTAFSGPVLVLSAYEPDEQLNEDQVANYMTKPCERDQFVTQLRQTVR